MKRTERSCRGGGGGTSFHDLRYIVRGLLHCSSACCSADTFRDIWQRRTSARARDVRRNVDVQFIVILRSKCNWQVAV